MQKYRFLPFAAKVLRIVAWVVLVVGILVSIVYGIRTGSSAGGVAGGFAGFFIAVAGVIFSFLTWVSLLAARELLYLLMDVEENTRNTAEGIAKKSD